MKHILIIDDNPTIRKGLEKVIHDYDVTILIHCVANEMDGLQIAKIYPIDLFLVDIMLHEEIIHDTSGIDFAKQLRTMNQYSFTPFVFITSISNLELYAFKEIHCYDYIIKPIQCTKVIDIIKRLQDYQPVQAKSNEWIEVRIDGIIFSIPVQEIIYLKSTRRMMEIHTIHEVFRIPYLTITKCLQNVKSKELIPCHRSIVVNRNYIYNIDAVNRFIILKNDYGRLEIGANIKKRFMEEMSK